MENIITIRDSHSDYFDLIIYPDGQQNIKLNLSKINIKRSLKITCSIKSMKELEVLLCVCAALDKNDICLHSIDIVYLFGLRSDRAFEPGMPNYVRDVLTPILININCAEIQVLHPHCSFVLQDNKLIPYITKETISFTYEKKCILIGGDESSFLSHPNPDKFPGFIKKRDPKGNIEILINEKIINRIEDDKESDILIFDDLCDGGATFIQESKILRMRYPERKLYLYVTHGLFSKGVDHVANHFDYIYCTNSFQDITHPKVTQFKVI